MTYEEARHLFSYDEGEGVLRWKNPRPRSRGVVGAPVGAVTRGRRTTVIAGRAYQVARLVWLYLYGEHPAGLVDHIDGDTLNDRRGNLRVVTRRQNAQNVDYRSPVNEAGFRGVIVRGKRFQARVVHKGRVIHLGTFDTPEEASQAYCKAKAELHSHWARKPEE